jgi:hypothetical protein
MKKKIIIFAILGFLGLTAYQAYAGNGNSYWPWNWHPDPPQNHKLDLKVSSVCHYYQNEQEVGCQNDGKPFGNWEATDLNCKHKFFNFPDVKPGDHGEDTIDLTVENGDACADMTISDILDQGNKCVEPETKTKRDRDCWHKNPGIKEKDGEMRENIEFQIWLDQGRTLGFQGKSDPGEGDNVFNEKDALMMDWTSLEKCPKTFQLRKFLRTDRQKNWNDCERSDSDGDGSKCKDKICNGVARDGRLIEGVTYYLGFAWRFPAEVGNEAQTDSLKFDLKFTAKGNESCSPCKDHFDRCED